MSAALILAAMAATTTADMQSILDSIRLDQEVPGVSAVITRHNEIIFSGASGVADLESERVMTPDTVLYAGSLTKMLTAVLTLHLVENSQLSLDDVVTGIGAKSSHETDDVTVMHLLTHASGLDREGNFGYWFSANFPDQKALARYLRDAELQYRPGTSIKYSNIAYAALGQVVGRASGLSYDQALSNLVLKPLGMAASGSPGPAPDVASGYSPVNRVIPSAANPFAGLGRRVGTRRIREYHDAKAMTPAFGAFTTARDLSRLARFLLGYGSDEVLSKNMRSRMLTRQKSGWGLGIKVSRYRGRPVARHGGWFAAHQSYLFLDLKSDISVVVMTNSDSATPKKIAEALFDGVLGRESGE